MATERRRHRLRTLAVLPAFLLLAAPVPARASTAWWQPLAYAGVRISAVSVAPGKLIVDTPAGRFLSTNQGEHLHGDKRHAIAVTATAQRRHDLGHPQRHRPHQSRAEWGRLNIPIPAPPISAPARTCSPPRPPRPGAVVAVGSDNHVWRRTPSGSWSTAFIPLPAGGLSGTPRVTALAAFTQPLTTAVYMGLDGYGVLLTQDGGDDWIRADPGLPENVLGLATDQAAKALYAATDQGLYVHHLQSFPAPPVYIDSALYLRWLGIAAVALAATIAALLALRRLFPRPLP